MNKDLVAAMHSELSLAVNWNCVKNKQRDLTEMSPMYEHIWKNLSGLGWQDLQVAWDHEVWEEFKQAHSHKFQNLKATSDS